MNTTIPMTGLAAVLSLLPALLSTTARGAEPFIHQQDIFVARSDGVRQYRIPALVRTNEGTLIAFCDARVDRGGDLPNHIDLVMKRSLDGGTTWSPMSVVLDFPRPNGGGDPTLLVDRQTGTVWMLYVFGIPAPEVKTRRRRLWAHAIRSDDDGRTWSRPMDVNDEMRKPGWKIIVNAPGMGIQMRGGRLLVPGYVNDGKEVHSYLTYSDDHGKTWGVGAPAAPKTNECQVVELVDGSLMLNMRSNRGKHRRLVAVSKDRGETWTDVRDDPTLVEPVCQASFIRYTTTRDGYARNRLLFANPASTKRENMTVRVSYDEGKTWPVSKVVHSGPAAYSCLAIASDGSICLLYERGKKSAYEAITFARFNLAWLTDGKDSLRKASK